MILVEFVISFEQSYHKVREEYQRLPKTDQKTKFLILGSLDNVLQKQRMSMAIVYDIRFKVAMVIW